MTQPEPRYCDECEHESAATREKPPYQRLCMRWPTTRGYGFVSRDYWDQSAPWRRCVEINTDGCCPMWERRRDGQMEMIGK